MCALTYRRIEEIQEIPVLREDSQPQPRTAVPQATPRGEHKVLAPLPRPRPLKPQNDDDDISRYSRVQIIDTSFQIQNAGESKIAAGIATLSAQDLDDPERLAAYLATVCGLPEEDCLVALKDSQQSQRNSFSDALDASRGVVAMSQDITPGNIYGNQGSSRSSSDSYGFPSTHSAHSSISSASTHTSYYNSSVAESSVTDYSSASESSDRTGSEAIWSSRWSTPFTRFGSIDGAVLIPDGIFGPSQLRACSLAAPD